MDTPVWFPRDPGPAQARVQGERITLQNAVLLATWELGDGQLWPKSLRNLLTRTEVHRKGPGFVLPEFGALRVSSDPQVVELAATPTASRLSERLAGQAVELLLTGPQGLRARWRAELRDGANSVRETLTLEATDRSANVPQVRFEWNGPVGARVVGTVPGSPVATDDLFFGLEHPISASSVAGNQVAAWVERKLPIPAGRSVAYSAWTGVAPAGQLRRAFLRTVERERAHPYRTFLHYNSWYDIGFFTPYDQEDCMGRIDAFGRELVQERGVKVDSFLFDDGWDDTSSVWEFHQGFPEGFEPLEEAATRIGSGPGIWLSPWGGYGGPREARLKTGAAQGYEIDTQGYALSGPKYYQRFRDVTLRMVRDYGINHFKLDGTGSPDKQVPGSEFASDFDAAIALIRDLRGARQDLYVNLTTGTWPSPFWLAHADSTWRGGMDHGFEGVGSERQRWITYRDADTYAGVVRQGPLYPLNSLMLHGLIYAREARGLKADPGGDFADEVRSYFGSGTQLQEMYISPELLSDADWDVLAEAAKWSRAHAAVLVDTHWVGGDPKGLEVYGWAAWSPGKGILTLRNPSDQPQAYAVQPDVVFELPGEEWPRTRFRARWHKEAPESFEVKRGESKVIVLGPFEVVTYEAESR